LPRALSVGTLFQLDKDVETQGVSMARGDTLLGDTLRSTLAEVTAQLVESGLTPTPTSTLTPTPTLTLTLTLTRYLTRTLTRNLTRARARTR
jgi:hypothetical protein